MSARFDVPTFGLFLLDNETITLNKLDQKKKIRLEKLDKVFFDLQVVPLFGDMQIAPFNYVKNSKLFDPSKWPQSNSVAVSPQANMLPHVPKMREEHIKYTSELARYSNEVTTTFKETPRTDGENRTLLDLSLRGLQLLSEWTSVVTELYS